MKKSKKEQLNIEIVVLFDSLWATLCEETKNIEKAWGQARNMACSEWRFNTLLGILEPVSLAPERTDLLNINFNKLVEANSRQKYFLIKAFLPTLEKLRIQLNNEQTTVYAYWGQELAKEDPELDNRFSKDE